METLLKMKVLQQTPVNETLQIQGLTSKHCNGLFDRFRDVLHVADFSPVCAGSRQGGHGLDGGQVMLQL